VLARYVDPKLTVMPFEFAREALAAALRDPVTRAPARREVLALAMAKCALETGRFQKIWNWNFGNIKAGASYPGMFTCITLNEVIGGRVQWFAPDGPVIRLAGGSFTPTAEPRVPVPPGHPQTRMRAHANRFDGAYAYVDFMQARATMWNALQTGDPYQYVPAMKRGGYFTADEAPYLRAVASITKEYSLKLEGRAPDETRLPEQEWTAARGLAALAIAQAAQAAVDYAREGGVDG
jgi:hypothetical protein